MLIMFPAGQPVLVIISSAENIDVEGLIANGAVRLETPGPLLAQATPRQLTPAEKKFLREKMDQRELPSTLRAFELTGEGAKRFTTDNAALDQVARQCGIGRSDLGRLIESRRRLRNFSPADPVQRRALRTLSELLFPNQVKQAPGRPMRISAEDRRRIQREAHQLKGDGKTKQQILKALTAHYCLEPSYLSRILDDANGEDN
jgi:hypothetical protein